MKSYVISPQTHVAILVESVHEHFSALAGFPVSCVQIGTERLFWDADGSPFILLCACFRIVEVELPPVALIGDIKTYAFRFSLALEEGFKKLKSPAPNSVIAESSPAPVISPPPSVSPSST